MLGMVAALASVDRQCFSVLLTTIQRDLRVNDAAMGFVTGSAFTIVYAVIALPLARVADHTNRRNFLAFATAVWSLATAACALTAGVFQLLIARIVVGAAEAARPPSTMSMLGDLFSASRRGSGVSVVIMGSSLGVGVGAALAGALNDSYGWRGALAIIGAPGLLVALLFWLTVREPVRGAQDAAGVAEPPRETIGQCLRRCARIRTIYPFGFGWLLLCAANTAWLTWMPAFLIRVHHLNTTKAGAIFGGVVLTATVGAVTAGVLTDVLARRGARWRLYYAFAALALCGALAFAALLSPTLEGAMLCLVLHSFVSAGCTAVGTAVYVSFAPPTMRGFVTALMGLLNALASAAGAPLFGAVNDVLKRDYGDQALRYTLLLSPVLAVAAGLLFLVASRTLDRDVALAASPTAA